MAHRFENQSITDGCNALLCCMFMESIPPSIYFPIRRRTAHKNFKYLAKCFRNSKPIPHTNEFQCTNTATAVQMLEKSPTSTNTATERHADAKWDKEDLSTTQDLTRGTEDVNSGNAGCMEDPRTSFKALVKGTSTKCSEMTPVILESAPHKMQTELQNSLPLTPRLPTAGEPSRCKQEAADSDVTAGRTNGTAEMAKPTEIADVDPEKAALGGDLAERACGVDEGNGTECKDLQLPKAELYCKEGHQCNGNVEDTIPSAYRLLLEGEWEVHASGEARNPRSSMNMPNAMPECVHHPSESRETEDAEGVESEGCERGMSERASVDETDGDAGQRIKPVDTPNEPDMLVTVSIKLESLNGDETPCICLGGTWMRTGDVNGAGNGADESNGQTDRLRGQTGRSTGQMDASNTSNNAGMAGMSDGEGAGTYLDARGMKRVVDARDGIGSQSDMSSGHWDVPSVETDAMTPANTTETVSIP